MGYRTFGLIELPTISNGIDVCCNLLLLFCWNYYLITILQICSSSILSFYRKRCVWLFFFYYFSSLLLFLLFHIHLCVYFYIFVLIKRSVHTLYWLIENQFNTFNLKRSRSNKKRVFCSEHDRNANEWNRKESANTLCYWCWQLVSLENAFLLNVQQIKPKKKLNKMKKKLERKIHRNVKSHENCHQLICSKYSICIAIVLISFLHINTGQYFITIRHILWAYFGFFIRIVQMCVN